MKVDSTLNLLVAAVTGGVVAHFQSKLATLRSSSPIAGIAARRIEAFEPAPTIGGDPAPDRVASSKRVRALQKRGYRIQTIDTPYGTVVLRSRRPRRRRR